MLIAGLVSAGPVAAATLTATQATLDATLRTLAGGDRLALIGAFGEVRLTNRDFSGVVTIDATQATFTRTMVFDNVRNLSLIGGVFNIGNNGNYAKGVAVYGGANIYMDRVTVAGGGNGFGDQYGISFGSTHNAQVTNSKFSGLYSAIGLGSVTGGFVAKNTITGSTSDGIDIADSHKVQASSNTCSGGTPGPGAHPDCIQMWSVAGKPLESDIIVTYNTATGATQGFTDFDAGLRINISYNKVNTSYSQGIACYSCVDSTISYNTVSTLPGSRYQTRVNILDGSNNTVAGNVVGTYVEPRSFGEADDVDPNAGMAGLFGDFPPISNDGLPDAGAVPEPSSWAMLIAGFAAVGVARRRAVVAGRIA